MSAGVIDILRCFFSTVAGNYIYQQRTEAQCMFISPVVLFILILEHSEAAKCPNISVCLLLSIFEIIVKMFGFLVSVDSLACYVVMMRLISLTLELCIR